MMKSKSASELPKPKSGKQDAPRASRRSRGSGQSRIADVARLADVSAQTVSRYFRNPSVVSPEASVRIRHAVDSLGYVPNLVAGSLASNRSRIVAIIVPTIANPAHSVWVQGLTEVLSSQGYQVLFGQTNYDPVQERDLVRTFLARRVDALAITGASLDPEAEAMLRRSMTPTIQIFELPEQPIDMAIGVDNRACGVMVADHFADRGYRRLAVVGSPALTDTRASARAAGFVDQAISRGFPQPAMFEAARPADVSCGTQLLADILAVKPDLDAVFCVGTQISVGLMLACARASVKVPERLAVAGFSHGDLAAMLNPSLTTIRFPAEEMGRQAGDMLLKRLAGRETGDVSTDVGIQLVIGEST